jgi:hypothetical protein
MTVSSGPILVATYLSNGFSSFDFVCKYLIMETCGRKARTKQATRDATVFFPGILEISLATGRGCGIIIDGICHKLIRCAVR